MELRLIGQAIGLFAVTNIDDIVILALFFGQAVGRSAALRVIIGQFLGFAGILAASILGALGAVLLPDSAVPYLGLLPLALGLQAAWATWTERRGGTTSSDEPVTTGPGILTVAAITLANGGDNIGVYVPVFATTDAGGLFTYVLVFVVLVAVCCAAGHYCAGRPAIARAMARWGDIALPVVLIVLGLAILIDGHAFGF